MQNLNLLLLALVPPLLIALYLYYRDKYVKEPVKLLVKSFFLGWLIVLPILFLHYILERLGLNSWLQEVIRPDTLLDSLWQSFILAALLEEGFKYIAFKKWIWSNRYFDEFYDGILYAALISLGFAALENIFYVMDYGYHTGITRAVTAIPAHAFFGIAMGYYFSRAKFNPLRRRRYLNLALFIPILLHGIYDVIVFEIARFTEPEDPAFLVFVGLFWVFMTGLLIWSLRRIRLMLRRDRGE